jgi:hypothetical protein
VLDVDAIHFTYFSAQVASLEGWAILNGDLARKRKKTCGSVQLSLERDRINLHIASVKACGHRSGFRSKDATDIKEKYRNWFVELGCYCYEESILLRCLDDNSLILSWSRKSFTVLFWLSKYLLRYPDPGSILLYYPDEASSLLCYHDRGCIFIALVS